MRSEKHENRDPQGHRKRQTTRVRAFGEGDGDGGVQLSFTLPVDDNAKGQWAAQMFSEQLGLKKVTVVQMEHLDDGLTSFVVKGQSDVEVDVSKIVEPLYEYPVFSFDEINGMIKSRLKRKIVVLGVCMGSEDQSTAIDTLFNMMGYRGDYGFESYPALEAVNLRSHMRTSDFVSEISTRGADVIVLSRVVGQNEEKAKVLQKILEEIHETPGVPQHLLKIYSGPRMTHEEASEIGFDAGFGPGTLPSQVASFIASELLKKLVG